MSCDVRVVFVLILVAGTARTFLPEELRGSPCGALLATTLDLLLFLDVVVTLSRAEWPERGHAVSALPWSSRWIGGMAA